MGLREWQMMARQSAGSQPACGVYLPLAGFLLTSALVLWLMASCSCPPAALARGAHVMSLISGKPRTRAAWDRLDHGNGTVDAAPAPASDGAAISPSAEDVLHAACESAGGTVCRSIARAEALLGSRRAGTGDRLLIPLLTYRSDRLCCSIANLQQQVFPNTPTDVFVFSQNNSAEAAAAAACPTRASLDNVYFLPVDEHWVTPPQARGPETWMTIATEDYRRMGHWRLLFQTEIADRLGYQYLLQSDDDGGFEAAVDFNIVDMMRQRGLLMAAARIAGELVITSTGLPELTAYFLQSEALQPTTLFQHCNPPSMRGLFTRPAEPDPGFTGWDMASLYGNCVLVDMHFWFRPDIQRYIRLIVNTGDHFRLRWQEQATMGMVWQVFVPEQNFSVLPVQHAHPFRCSK